MAEEFRINEEYAKKYNKWREKEELQKLKDKYGDVNSEEEDSSSSESEDEDAEGLTAEIERDWLRTLAALKSKDPRIYDKNVQFYQDDEEEYSEEEKTQSKKKKDKPVFLKDYERKVILEKDGKLEDESDDEAAMAASESQGYYEEQEQLKESLKAAIESDSDEDNFLQARKKTNEEQKKEEEDYLLWLKGQKKDLKKNTEIGIELDPLKSYWNKPDLDDREKFLRDYILNKGYKEVDGDRIPTYDEIVRDDVDLSEEENILEKQEDFERKYNFRFEEPDEEFIKSYPRTMSDTVRRKENKRAKKRQEIKERKQREKEKKKEELKQLKNLKKREIMDKLDKLKQITGNESVGFSHQDFEGDFDPEQHDKLMQQVFSEEYYGDEEVDETKPTWDDDEDLGLEENWDNWQGGDENYEEQQYTAHSEDPNFNMDADYDPSKEFTVSQKKKKKRSKFKDAIQKKKPVFDPEDKSFEDYFDEYYKLDYEDIIDDLPCRFKYRNVTANDFGLATEEILKAREKELNAWVSLKKMSQYRSEEEEHFDIKCYKRKAEHKKYKILTSLMEPETEEAEQSPKKKPTATVTRADMQHQPVSLDHPTQVGPEPSKSDEDEGHDDSIQSDSAETKLANTTSIGQSQDSNPRKKKRKKKKKIVQTDPEKNVTNTKIPKDSVAAVVSQDKMQKNVKKKFMKNNKKRKHDSISDDRLKAYGINPKKFKYMDKFNNFKKSS